MSRLYRIDVRTTIFVLAEDEHEARDIAIDQSTVNSFDLLHEAEVERAARYPNGKLMKEDWSDTDLVWHDEDAGDITLARADEIDREAGDE